MVGPVGSNPQLKMAIALAVARKVMNADAVNVAALLSNISVPQPAASALGTKIDVKG